MHSKYCKRCRFIVPAMEPICHTCGNAGLVVSEQVMAQPLAVTWQDDQAQVVVNYVTQFIEELSDTAQKFARACHTFARLIRGV